MTSNDRNAYVGKRLRLRRVTLGMSQDALAKAVGITFQQVQKYEKGTNAMNVERLCQFSQVMRVPMEYFFDGISETAEVPLSTYPANSGLIVSDRETLEIMKAFKRLKQHSVRKRMADLIRSLADLES